MSRAVRLLVLLLLALPLAGMGAFAAEPLVVGGPNFGRDGEPFVWNPASMPIRYTVDAGPLSATLGHAIGRSRVQNMFQIWQDVPTANISFSYAGPILGGDGQAIPDVRTIEHFSEAMQRCRDHGQSAVIFDADGSLSEALGLGNTLGFASICGLDTDSNRGYITGAAVVLNGKYQDGDVSNGELPNSFFDAAITHEIGHLAGLGHSQVNIKAFEELSCAADPLAGVPLMFSVGFCEPPSGSEVLRPDDLSAISRLYPNAQTAASYGTLRGRIRFSDGVTQVQGVNVVARRVDDPNTPQDESLRIAVSSVSGHLFTGNPGQPVTGDNPGSPTGSRKTEWIGFFEMLVPSGEYTLEVESVTDAFTGGSVIGPLNPAVPLPSVPEYWNEYESAFDFPLQHDTITVQPGQVVEDLDIILNGTPPRFDIHESTGTLYDAPLSPGLEAWT